MDRVDAVENETGDHDRVLTRRMYGRTWRFGTPDIRPTRLRRYAQLADALAGKSTRDITGVEAIELSAVAEEMLRAALPADDREAFDDAPFTGTDIGDLATAYFAALGVGPGESAASPTSSRATRRRSRRTSKPPTGSR